MTLNRLTLRNFRNYETGECSFSPGLNVIYGRNAQGKTNLLEAAAALSTMQLFRTAHKREAIRFGETEGSVKTGFFTEGRDFTLEMRFFQTKSVEVWRNGVKMRRQREAAGLLRTVLFCPDDLRLIRDSASARRRFLDTALCQLRPQYAQALAEYNRLLDHKTRILRDSEEKPSLLQLLDDFTLKMCQYGARILVRRAKFVRKLAQKAALAHQEMSGGSETLALHYRTVSEITDPFASPQEIAQQLFHHAMEHRRAEIAAHSCLSGPHKDDLILEIDGKSAADFGSQGQVRTCALALKLSERALFFEDSGEYPVLLLDDVMSELDRRRQAFLMEAVAGGQTLLTCCEEESAARVSRAKRIRVEQGRILEET